VHVCPDKETGMADHPAVKNLTVEEVKAGMEAGRILLVDVREPNELAVERIPGAIEMPLQSFDPAALPDPGDKQLVFSCRSGNRSVTASLRAQEAGFPYASHMAGGIKAWKEAGFKTDQG
jgi:rhodanese-related sulfurtransferase